MYMYTICLIKLYKILKTGKDISHTITPLMVSTHAFCHMCVKSPERAWVHSKSFIKVIGILLLIVWFIKSEDQTIQIMRKNKSTLMFLIDCNN